MNAQVKYKYRNMLPKYINKILVLSYFLPLLSTSVCPNLQAQPTAEDAESLGDSCWKKYLGFI